MLSWYLLSLQLSMNIVLIVCFLGFEFAAAFEDDPRALCKTEGIRLSQNYQTRKGSTIRNARLDKAELTKLYNDKVDYKTAFNSMRRHVVVANACDPLNTSAVAIVYFWLEMKSNVRLLGENAVDSILSALHVAHADVFLVSYEEFISYFCTFIIYNQPCSYLELSAILSFQPS
jgi:hypothetical protein